MAAPRRSRHAAAARTRRGPAPRADAPYPRDSRPARPQLLGARAGHPPGRRPRRARGVPVRQDPGLHRGAGRDAAHARGPRVLARPARRLHHAAPGGHLGGHVAEHIALEFQNLAGTDVRHGKTRSHRRVRPLQRDLRVPRGAGRDRGRQDGGRRSSTTSLRRATRRRLRLRGRARDAHPPRRAARFGPSTQALLDEAAGRDIPYIRLDRFSLVQLGQGVHQQRIRATMTSRTGGIAVDIASDKKLTNRLLDSAGLPVPRSEVVVAEEEAVAAARRLGYPCVVKPLDGNHGRGVALDLRPRTRSGPRSRSRCARAAPGTSSSRATSRQ